jgi:hypothetical protein
MEENIYEKKKEKKKEEEVDEKEKGGKGNPEVGIHVRM